MFGGVRKKSNEAEAGLAEGVTVCVDTMEMEQEESSEVDRSRVFHDSDNEDNTMETVQKETADMGDNGDDDDDIDVNIFFLLMSPSFFFNFHFQKMKWAKNEVFANLNIV